MPLFGDFLVSTQTQPSRELHISTHSELRSTTSTDNLEYAPTGLGFRRRGAPERLDGTKGYGRHTMCLQVLVGLHMPNHSLTPCVGS